MIFIVVESPTKAKAINEYLKTEQEKYKVLSTYGHVRNLVTKSGSIETDKGYKYHWKTTLQWEKHKNEILNSASQADKIIIATDLDREGEGIAWHFDQMLKNNKINKETQRIVFHSVSKKAILEALETPGQLRTGLVESYLARIGLDYLFGFSISPLLWHKIPCCKSAGRVQSVALRLIVEREYEILNFKTEQYFKIEAKFAESNGTAFMQQFDDREFENGNIFGQKVDINLVQPEVSTFTAGTLKKQQFRQAPQAPFITSTMLQAASSRLNFSPAMTTQLAQKLYEGFTIGGKHVGLITYMRTDSVNIEPTAIKEIRAKIAAKFDPEYLPKSANSYKSTTKNAQEAHEAIRPVDINLEPNSLNLGDRNLEALYRLIWERTMASQMAAALMETVTVQIHGNHFESAKKAKLEHTSIFELKTTNTLFPGFKILEKQDEEDDENPQKSKTDLSKIRENSELNCKEVIETEHQTQPPRRYSEATLIQQLEKRGIGRPSTYPKIISVLYEREYASKSKKIISPTQKGWVVTAFLKQFFVDEVAYEFTAKLEDDLDELNENNGQHLEILDKFWQHLDKTINFVNEKNPLEISSGVQIQFPNYFHKELTKCPKCDGNLLLKITRFGAMLGCSNYPNCKEVVNIGENGQDLQENDSQMPNKTWEIENRQIELKKGPYGPYIEFHIQGYEDNKDHEENEVKKAKKGQKKKAISNVKRIPVPKIWQDDLELDEEKVAFLADLPKELGEFEGKKVTIGIGRFGPFIKHDSTFVSVKDPLDITFEQALELLAKKRTSPAKPRKIFTKFSKKTEEKDENSSEKSIKKTSQITTKRTFTKTAKTRVKSA